MSWKRVASYIAVDCPTYLFELDEHRNAAGEQMLFVHLLVRQWSKSTLKTMLHVFKQFRECVTCPLYASTKVDDEKWSRFISYFGFVPLLHAVCEDGQTRRLFINLKVEE
jgi:hypothetical protein